MDKIILTIRKEKFSVICLIGEKTLFFFFKSTWDSHFGVTFIQCLLSSPHRGCVNLVEIATNNSAQIIFMFNPVLSSMFVRACACIRMVKSYFSKEYKDTAVINTLTWMQLLMSSIPLDWTCAYHCAHTLLLWARTKIRLNKSTFFIDNFKKKKKKTQRALSHFSFDGYMV